MNKRFYLCQLYLRTAAFPISANFVTLAIASDKEEAQRIAFDSVQQNFPQQRVEVLNATISHISNTVLEQAAIEVLGWRKPSD